MRAHVRGAAMALCLLGLAAAPSPAAIPIHAHRGGPYADGVPVYPDQTIPAFRNAARRGWVLEVDAQLTRDGIPLAIHDATLDRTTVCSGEVRDRTSGQIRRKCPSDVLGSPPSGVPGFDAGLPWRFSGRKVRVPTLVEVLRMAGRHRAGVNLEMKNLPTDSDFDPSGAYARTVVRAVKASKLPRRLLMVQSFWPPNLEVVKRELPRVRTALLTLQQMNSAGPAFAAANDYGAVAPQFSASDFALVTQAAHRLNLDVIPWTLNDAPSIAAAAANGADAVITDDPPMAERALP
jgi:glycerophosphoryl diester phosphodiesterase